RCTRGFGFKTTAGRVLVPFCVPFLRPSFAGVFFMPAATAELLEGVYRPTGALCPPVLPAWAPALGVGDEAPVLAGTLLLKPPPPPPPPALNPPSLLALLRPPPPEPVESLPASEEYTSPTARYRYPYGERYRAPGM